MGSLSLTKAMAAAEGSMSRAASLVSVPKAASRRFSLRSGFLGSSSEFRRSSGGNAGSFQELRTAMAAAPYNTGSASSSPSVVAAEYVADEAKSSASASAAQGFPKFEDNDDFRAGLLALDNESFSDEDDEFVESSDGEGVSSTDSEADDPLAVVNLGLDKQLVAALLGRGIARLFPIQEAVMQPAMAGRDVIARAKTGTGKTLAFGIPILDKLSRENKSVDRRRAGGPRAMVLAPTRELANQVNRELTESAPHLTTLCVYGGVPIDGQIRQLRRGVDIVVGTPGRVTDLMERGALELDCVKFMVLDEADQMLAVGFEEDVERIMKLLPEIRQTQLFSATMPSWVNKLSKKYLDNPVTIDLVGEKEDKLSDNIHVCCVRVPTQSKRNILNDLITVYAKGGKSIVFTQTKRDADDVSVSLSRSIGCQALHGDIPQSLREKTLQAFRDGKFGVLVATDVAARGLDIPNVDLVIHYEIPNDAETFVHRSGRTGRAGKNGTAILMYSDSQSRTLRNIERDINNKFERISAPHAEEIMDASVVQVTSTIDKVHPQLTAFFQETAENLLAEKGTAAFASALAHMSGYTQPPPVRSLITFEEGKVTLRLVRRGGSRHLPMASARQLMLALREIYPPAADAVGKIKMLSDRDTEGAVFDLPEEIAEKLLKCKLDDGDFIDRPKVLPPVVDDSSRFDRRTDNYGRFSGSRDRPRGGDRYGGGSRGGSSFGGRDRYDRGPSSGRQGSSRGGYGGSERLGRFDERGDRGGSSRPPARRSYGDDWEVDGPGSSFSSPRTSRFSDRPSRSLGGSGGLCFLCNQPGHRAADCPSKR